MKIEIRFLCIVHYMETSVRDVILRVNTLF